MTFPSQSLNELKCAKQIFENEFNDVIFKEEEIL